MNIAQINQGQQAHPSKDPRATEIDPTLLQAFKGQLQFAEADLDLHPFTTSKAGDPRDRYEAVEQKRHSDDEEQAAALSFWHEQKADRQVEQALNNRSLQQQQKSEFQDGKSQDRQMMLERAGSQKQLNQEMGTERILKHKPHVIAAGMENEQSVASKEEFSNLLQNTQKSQLQAQQSTTGRAMLSEMPAEADPVKAALNQEQMRFIKDQAAINKAPKAGKENTALNTIQSSTKKPETRPDQRLVRQETLLDPKQQKQSTTKSERFTTQLDTAQKESQKIDTQAPVKKAETSEAQTQNTREVISNIKILLSSSKDTLVMRLMPEHLGKLEIRLKKAGGQLSGEFKVENAEARDLLLKEFSQLQKNLEAQGIKLDQYSIYVKGQKNQTESVAASRHSPATKVSAIRPQRDRSQTSGAESNPSVPEQNGEMETPVRIVI